MNFTALALAAAAVSLPFASAQHKITFSSAQGWIDDEKVWFYNFGPHSTPGTANGSTIALAPIWVPSYRKLKELLADEDLTNGTKAGNNIINAIPCDAGYSDLWKVNFVTVPATYPLNAFKSAADVLAAAANPSGVTINSTAATLMVNCPVVPFGSTAVDTSGSATATVPKYVNGWYKGAPVFYFDFGPVTTINTDPVYHISLANGTITDPGVFEGYSTPFWNLNIVTVPASVAGTDILRSQSEILATKYPINNTALVVNCPFAYASTTATPPSTSPTASTSTDPTATGMHSGADAVKTSVVVTLAMVGAVAFLFL
ncbi:hypothetical protein BDK51DRAFT_27632 [Blyttiomyces helicus]|uniref:Uncharacterized protein n=1 Tax=Blyttiomyces helicus TaxID=388810 RepID=A0A4P9WD98_9FUNG|nr:hypothetical protein BDK51DRAFT_27632 [Blyttiomyces helicus]|eukprot:RKO88920.1 hypothetical protein BDK51DRAFT_27632 [Blyttiomyces helicus]